MPIDGKPIKGRGATQQVTNRFLRRSSEILHWEGIDEVDESDERTRFVVEHARSIVNRVTSPDLGFTWSMNPYQGCEHGCAYCYARPTHEYWGYGAGLDFERIILVKRNAPEVLRATLMDRKWQAAPIMFSGNTDCYQPVERRERITRRMLEICLAFKQPVAMITKNALILRDVDLLAEMASMGLAHVAISLTTLNEDLRRVMEPRTSSAVNRLKAMEELSRRGVPTMAMLAPVIPGLNAEELPALLEASAQAGALAAGYTVVRTNGVVKPVFEKWLQEHFPDRAAKVIAQVSDMHGGAMNDSRFGRRMKGEGEFARSVSQLFRITRRRFFEGRKMPALRTDLFQRPEVGQLDLFGSSSSGA